MSRICGGATNRYLSRSTFIPCGESKSFLVPGPSVEGLTVLASDTSESAGSGLYRNKITLSGCIRLGLCADARYSRCRETAFCAASGRRARRHLHDAGAASSGAFRIRLRSLSADAIGVDTCDHVWEASPNAGKFEHQSVETIKNRPETTEICWNHFRMCVSIW